MPIVIALLVLLLVVSLGLEKKNKKMNMCGTISLIVLVIGLICSGINNNYGLFFIETITAIIIFFYYMFLFNIYNNKKIKLLVFLVILFILFFPIKIQYLDGGTKEYKAFAYRIIKWHRLKNYGRIKKETSIILFPNNFHSLEYYDDDVEPPVLEVYTKGVNSKSILCEIGTYNWTKNVDNEKISSLAIAVDPINFKYKEHFTITNVEKIYLSGISPISDIKIQSLENKDFIYDKIYNYAGYFEFNQLPSGTYIITFKYSHSEGYAYYSFKINIEKE